MGGGICARRVVVTDRGAGICADVEIAVGLAGSPEGEIALWRQNFTFVIIEMTVRLLVCLMIAPSLTADTDGGWAPVTNDLRDVGGEYHKYSVRETSYHKKSPTVGRGILAFAIREEWMAIRHGEISVAEPRMPTTCTLLIFVVWDLKSVAG